MTRYGMAIDKARCVACNRCAMACKVEHGLPDSVLWNRGLTVGGDAYMTPGGEYPSALKMESYTLACQHCDNPACVAVCPTSASYKREDGIVVVNYDRCIGCGACILGCPYHGVRTMVKDPAYSLDFKMGDATVPDIQENTVCKCTFCVERIERGEKPRCIDVCFCDARWFGDLDDPNSDVNKAMENRQVEQLHTEAGTGPNVYYLV